MLNYIWVGLLVVAMLFAMGADLGDIGADTYRNGKVISVVVKPEDTTLTKPQAVRFVVDADAYKAHYGKPGELDLPATLRRSGDKLVELSIKTAAGLPAPFDVIAARTKTSDGDIVAKVERSKVLADGTIQLDVKLPPVLIQKIAVMGEAAIDTAKSAVTLALGLIGVLSLWLGLMRVAEKSGLVDLMVKFVRPVLAPLFPGVPREHPAMGMIALNLSANMLGLSNAATPFGIRAMEELQKLNPKKDTASNAMVMLLALNTAGVQLMPSATLVAVMGLQAAVIFFPMLIVTAAAAVVAIIAVFLLQPFFKIEAAGPEPVLADGSKGAVRPLPDDPA